MSVNYHCNITHVYFQHRKMIFISWERSGLRLMYYNNIYAKNNECFEVAIFFFNLSISPGSKIVFVPPPMEFLGLFSSICRTSHTVPSQSHTPRKFSGHYSRLRHHMKRFLRYLPFVRAIHRSPVDSPHKGPVALTFDVSFDVSLDKLLDKQSNGWWFRTSRRSCDVSAMWSTM